VNATAAAGRKAFTADLQIVRDALAIAEERAKATEQRAVREIDAERQRRILAVKEVERERDRVEVDLSERTVEARAPSRESRQFHAKDCFPRGIARWYRGSP